MMAAPQITCFQEFLSALFDAGFSMAGGNDDGIYAIIPWGWNEEPPYDTPVRWHTGDPETDPWEWRMRVLDERNDIVYSKIFFNKGGYLTKQWLPCFLAVRRGGCSFEEKYADGLISHSAKRVYEAIQQCGPLPLEQIKRISGFGKESKSQFDRALLELQMKMYIAICGRRQKIDRMGESYGWASTVFSLSETVWDKHVFDQAEAMPEQEAIEKITKQIYRLNPKAHSKTVLKFIRG